MGGPWLSDKDKNQTFLGHQVIYELWKKHLIISSTFFYRICLWVWVTGNIVHVLSYMYYPFSLHCMQGSHTRLEFQTSLEKVLNFIYSLKYLEKVLNFII